MPKTPKSRPVTVLVVEDNALVLITAMMIVTEAGYIGIAAEDAAGAMKALEAHPDIGALFSDIDMPGEMDGIGLAHETHRLWPAIKILMVSGETRPAVRDLPREARFLRKPYTSAQITANLNELMAA